MPTNEIADMRDIGVHYYVPPDPTMDEDDDPALVYCPATKNTGRIVFEYASAKRGLCEMCGEMVRLSKD